MANRGAVKIEGLNGFLRDMNRAPKELQDQIRDNALRIAEPIAEDARRRATTQQERLVAPAIKAKRDRIPVVKLGGAKRLASSTPRAKQPKASDVYFGADFGSNTLRQFPAVKKGGRLFYPAIEGRSREIADAYLDMVERVFKGRRR